MRRYTKLPLDIRQSAIIFPILEVTRADCNRHRVERVVYPEGLLKSFLILGKINLFYFLNSCGWNPRWWWKRKGRAGTLSISAASVNTCVRVCVCALYCVRKGVSEPPSRQKGQSTAPRDPARQGNTLAWQLPGVTDPCIMPTPSGRGKGSCRSRRPSL